MTGPLEGLRVVEMAGIGPAPFAVMLLADLGADVVRVDRTSSVDATTPSIVHSNVIRRGRRSIAVDLKRTDGRDVVLDLLDRADILVEGFRPGVMERLGLGPAPVYERNPRLVYGRMTGWGQDGPLAQSVGHDIGYIAITGALHGIGRADELPVPPLNLLGDLGGGALFLVVGVLAALHEVERTGRGQVVDAAVVDGTSVLTNFIRGLRAEGTWSSDERGSNLLDSGAPFYEVYACADGLPLAVGALEPEFYEQLLQHSGIPVVDAIRPENRLDRDSWAAGKAAWSAWFATKPRAEWLRLLEGTDACVAPVLDWDEAAQHPHLVARGTYLLADGVVQAAPAPRFGATRLSLGLPPARAGAHTDEVLRELGHDAGAIATLRADGTVA
ncbi:MAG: CaiB/BaiF CoA-transferase family protein [Candidatus Nanopelagicales bacterium]